MSFPVCYGQSGKYIFGVLQTVNNGATWGSPQKEAENISASVDVIVD
jgi:hypothetical protein